MTQLLLALVTVMPQVGVVGECGLPQHVLAVGKPNYRKQYHTEHLLDYRLALGQLTQAQVDDPRLAGYVAVVDCSLIGRRVGITWPGGHETWPYLVIDCRERHLPPLPDDPWVAAVELDEAEWLEHYDWGMFARREGVTVWQPDLSFWGIWGILQ